MEVFSCKKTLNLSNCEIGKIYYISEISNDMPQIKKRLLQLGFLKKEKVIVIQKSMLKKTILVQIQNYVLSMRSTISDMVKLS